MIEIRRHDNGFSISGHAGYAPPGQDIVCAAVSALFQTFIASLEELTGDDVKVEIGANRNVLKYKDLSEQGQLLEKSFFCGCEMIAANYPDYVRIVQAVE